MEDHQEMIDTTTCPPSERGGSTDEERHGDHHVPPQTATALPPPDGWPVLDEAALIGLPGDIVKVIEPHTEADPVALLVNILVGFGNLVGSQPHFSVEFDCHPPRLNAVLVGETSKG